MKTKSTTKAHSTKRAPAKNSALKTAVAFIHDCEHTLIQACGQLDKHYAKATDMIQAEAKQLKAKLDKAKNKLLASKKKTSPKSKVKSKTHAAQASKLHAAANIEHDKIKTALSDAEETLTSIKNQHKRHQAKQKAIAAFEKQWDKTDATRSKKKKAAPSKAKTASAAHASTGKSIVVKRASSSTKATATRKRPASKTARPVAKVAKTTRARRPLANAHTAASV